ncbi:hypothetical protein C8R47DRAFT_1123853 [Mycena vitilis]|nr:hypothetical protein C8R47DRAFT_1123853 [Mycena vitilis]
MAHLLVSNLCFCSILVRTGVVRYDIRNSTELKSAADTFEAYVGAYFRQKGEDQLDRWICANFGPLAEELIPACFQDYDLDTRRVKRSKRHIDEADAEAPRAKRHKL